MLLSELDLSDNIIELSDITERVDALRSERDDLRLLLDDAKEEVTLADGNDPAAVQAATAAAMAAQSELDAFADTDEGKELAALESILDDLKGYGGDHQWEGEWYPARLIRDSHFSDYVEELAADIHGKAVTNADWPFNCIDWDKAADQAKVDYSSTDIDGTEYLYR